MTAPPTPESAARGPTRPALPLLLRPRDWPITAKFARDLGLAAIVPLLVVFWVNAASARGALDAAARQNLQLLSRVTATRLDQLLTDTSRAADQLGREEPVVALCSAAHAAPDLVAGAGRKLDLLLATNPDVALASITDARGVVVVSTDPEMVGKDYMFRRYVREALAGRPHISEVLVGATTRRPGVYFSAPVREGGGGPGAGDVVGTATIKLQGERIWEIVDAVRIGDRGHAMLTDADGVVVAHPDRSRLYHSLAALPPDRLAAIDPRERFGSGEVPTLAMDALAAGVLGIPAGTLDYAPPPGATAPGPWVAGFARLHLVPWSVTATEPRAQFEAPMDRLARQQFIIVGLVALGAAGLALHRARAVLRPVLDLTHAADRLAGGDLDARSSADSHDEIGRLAAVFNSMVPRLKAHVDLQQSLAVAMDVQKSLLPEKDPALPRLDVAGRSLYCDQTGGDYYDFLDVSRISPTGTLIAVGDVMGHGVASALIMAAARAALRAHAHDESSLGTLLTKVNAVLAQDDRHHRFVTMLLLVLDPDRGVARWASAGHDPAIVYDPAADAFTELEGGSFPLGIEAGAVYEDGQWPHLRPGLIVAVGTDGIWEADNPEGELFGKDRLREVIRASRDRPAAEIAAALEQTLAAFRGPAPVRDDVTFVVARVH